MTDIDIEEIRARAEIKIGMLRMGEPIAFGSDADLMEELLSALEAEKKRADEAERLVYVPCLWRCAKCNFTLVQSNLNAFDGTMTARNDPGDRCPNCASPLWRVSWKTEADDRLATFEKCFDEKAAITTERDTLREEVERLREARSLEFAIEHQGVAKAICLAVSGCDLGPSSDPEENLQLYDLIPEEWIGGHQTRADVGDNLAENIAFAVLGAWLRATDAALTKKEASDGQG